MTGVSSPRDRRFTPGRMGEEIQELRDGGACGSTDATGRGLPRGRARHFPRCSQLREHERNPAVGLVCCSTS